MPIHQSAIAIDTSSDFSAELKPAELIAQILHAADPTVALHEALAAFGRELDAPLLALYRASLGINGEFVMIPDVWNGAELDVNLDLDGLGDAVAALRLTEFTGIDPIIRSVNDLPREISLGLETTGAHYVVVQPVSVGNQLVALLVIATRLEVDAADHAFAGSCAVAADIVATAILRTQLEHKLGWQLLYDPLTSLANRTLLLNDLRRALARAQRSGNMVGILFMDLDGFQEVNDHFGHSTGDELLVCVANRMIACVRSGETVARLGGDEFVILLEGLTSESDASRAASRILDAVRMPTRLSHGNVDITASMGISLACGEPVDPDELLVRAGAALQQVKKAGRACYQFYESN